MKALFYTAEGEKGRQIELPVELFSKDYSETLIYEVVRAENANRRQGTHKTKQRSEVHGGGKKPWRQKGTGNARHGSIRSPQWKGGGVVFGPQPRSYRIQLPRKVRQAGIRSIFSSRAGQGVVSIIADLNMDRCHSAGVYQVFKKMGLVPRSTVAYITNQEDGNLKRSFANIRNIELLHARRLTVPELCFCGQLVIEESALGYLVEHYAKKQSVKKQSLEKQSTEKQNIEKQKIEKQSAEEQSAEEQRIEKQKIEKQTAASEER